MPTSTTSPSPVHTDAAARLTSSTDGFVRMICRRRRFSGDISAAVAFLERRMSTDADSGMDVARDCLVVSAEGRSWAVTAHSMAPSEGGKGVRLTGSMLDRASRVAKVVKAALEPASDEWPPAPLTARQWALALAQEDEEPLAA